MHLFSTPENTDFLMFSRGRESVHLERMDQWNNFLVKATNLRFCQLSMAELFNENFLRLLVKSFLIDILQDPQSPPFSWLK